MNRLLAVLAALKANKLVPLWTGLPKAHKFLAIGVVLAFALEGSLLLFSNTSAPRLESPDAGLTPSEPTPPIEPTPPSEPIPPPPPPPPPIPLVAPPPPVEPVPPVPLPSAPPPLVKPAPPSKPATPAGKPTAKKQPEDKPGKIRNYYDIMALEATARPEPAPAPAPEPAPAPKPEPKPKPAQFDMLKILRESI